MLGCGQSFCSRAFGESPRPGLAQSPCKGSLTGDVKAASCRQTGNGAPLASYITLADFPQQLPSSISCIIVMRGARSQRLENISQSPTFSLQESFSFLLTCSARILFTQPFCREWCVSPAVGHSSCSSPKGRSHFLLTPRSMPHAEFGEPEGG